MTATEVAQLEVADVLDERGEFKRRSELRPAISFNGRPQPVYWVNQKLCDALDAYFAERVKMGHGVTAWRSQWRGLVQLGPVFLTNDGRPFTLTTRKTGIEAAGATSARRTFGVRLHRAGYDLRHIRDALGLATLSAAKALCAGDPVDLGRIAAKVI